MSKTTAKKGSPKGLLMGLVAAIFCLLLVFVAAGASLAIHVRGVSLTSQKAPEQVIESKSPEVLAEGISEGPDRDVPSGSKEKAPETPAQQEVVQEAESQPQPQAAPAPRTYQVKCGDNLTFIAQAHNVKLCQLIEANPEIENPNLLEIGQQIVIPEAA